MSFFSTLRCTVVAWTVLTCPTVHILCRAMKQGDPLHVANIADRSFPSTKSRPAPVCHFLEP